MTIKVGDLVYHNQCKNTRYCIIKHIDIDGTVYGLWRDSKQEALEVDSGYKTTIHLRYVTKVDNSLKAIMGEKDDN